MSRTSSDWFLDYLACPDCASPIPKPRTGIQCTCGYTREPESPLDLRPLSPRARKITVDIGTTADSDLKSSKIERPISKYQGPSAARDSSELFSAVHDQLAEGMRLLDLGCGPRDQSVVAEHYGLQYVGVDYSSKEADIRVDAHAVPFQNDVFNFVFSYAVLEHLYNPFLAVSEAHRVLKPGGVYFGTVSQGEPFHDSFYHHTAWGTLHVLKSAGFRIVQLWHSYDTLRALATMGRYPRIVKPMMLAFDVFLNRFGRYLSPRKFREWSRRDLDVDALHRAASICFVAVKD